MVIDILKICYFFMVDIFFVEHKTTKCPFNFHCNSGNKCSIGTGNKKFCKGKSKVVPLLLAEHNAMKTYWGWRYSSTHSLTSALDGGEWSTSRPGRFTPRERAPWYPLDSRLGGPQSRSGRGGEEKNSQPPPGIEP
jgi:hypothetical protein